MKRYIIYTTLNLAIMVVIVLLISGEILPAVLGVALMFAMQWHAKRTKTGRKIWLTWYRVGLEFENFLMRKITK